jgi:hypothetical protein
MADGRESRRQAVGWGWGMPGQPWVRRAGLPGPAGGADDPHVVAGVRHTDRHRAGCPGVGHPERAGGGPGGGTAIDAWLSSFLACPQGANKVSKLARAINVAERHLVIVLDPCSQAGMGISLALADHQEEGSAHDTIPSLVPPEPLTHVWLMPMMGPGTALWWARQRGWAVTNPMASTPR